MDLKVKIVDDVLQKFPNLRVLVGEVKGVRVSEADPRLEEFKEEVFAEVKKFSAPPPQIYDAQAACLNSLNYCPAVTCD